ncbi:hypothetical protein [uncultured Roseobacter sp.]|uniref:hypothetical protein n=1 Tax=uncultured Roseobacter sp. TaxID=114847 RepID=UPI0026267C61|nr:hypothetical protein [uncultured Roseobacter sp.]
MALVRYSLPDIPGLRVAGVKVGTPVICPQTGQRAVVTETEGALIGNTLYVSEEVAGEITEALEWLSTPTRPPVLRLAASGTPAA